MSVEDSKNENSKKNITIAFSNQKGGVGKTATAINVAGALNNRGLEVLFVDLDPQGNATEGLGLTDVYLEEPPTLKDVLTNEVDADRINDLVRSHDEMDVIPSNIDMTSIEPELVFMRRGGEQLAPALDTLERDYDYIIIDCPPYLGYLTDNGLHAAQNVMIPALAEATSKRAIELLFDHIQVLEDDYDIFIDDVGVIANRIDVRKNEAQEMLEWFDDAFDGGNVWRVRERADIQRAFTDGHSIFAVPEEERCDQAAVFLDIAAELNAMFGVETPQEVVA